LKIQSHVGLIGLALLSLFFTACGGGDGPSGSEPTLGITSIERMGATAIPNNSIASGKLAFAKSFMNEMNLLFEDRLAHAVTTGVCPPIAHTSFGIKGGKICLEEVFIILDEVQFNTSPTSSGNLDSLEVGPFGLDLLNTEPLISQFIDISVPPGEYANIKFRVKRIEDTPPPGSKIPDLLRNTLFEPTVKRRPSVWIKGCIDDGTTPLSCKPFIFVTDRRWEETISFNKFSGDTLDAVLELNLEKAFNSALNSLPNGATATDLKNEIGGGAIDNMGPGFLDGRKKNKAHGTEIAELIADQLPLHFRILVQAAAVVDFENSVAGTIIDNSAKTVSQPVNEADIRDCTQDLDCP